MKRYLSFFGVALLLAIAPGPDILFVLAESISEGTGAGCAVSAGLMSGCLVHVTLAACGFAAVVKRYPRVFDAVTWFGAGYLIYLGVMSWPSFAALPATEGMPAPATVSTSTSFLHLYFRGIIMNLSNPKVILFFLALMPRFIAVEAGHTREQFLLLGVLFVVATGIVFGGVSLVGGGLSALLGSPQAQRVLQYFAALVLFGIALWMAYLNLRHPKR